MDRSADNLGQTISNIQRDLEELKSNQGNGSGGGGGGGEEYFAGDGITISNNTISADTNVLATKEDLTDYAELSDLATVATSGSYNDLTNKPTIPAAQVNSDWNASSGVAEILNKPNLATVATSGSYNDLTNKPTIPAAQVNSDWNSTSGVSEILNKPTLATVATSGSYNDLTDKPTIPTVNNATLTIQKNGTTVQTFTANQSTAATANITVPTKTSDITNDSGFASYSIDSTCSEGKSINLSTAGNAPIASFQLNGETSQNGTPTPSAPVAVNNTTGENVVKIAGKNIWTLASSFENTSSSVAWVLGDTAVSFQAGTYTFSCTSTASSDVNVVNYKYADNADHYIAFKDVATLNFENEVKKIAIALGGNVSISNIQLEKGSTATTYEPYHDTNYEVNLGKNLLNPTGISTTPVYHAGVDVSLQSDGTILLNGTATGDEWVNIMSGDFTTAVYNITNIGQTTVSLTQADGTLSASVSNGTVARIIHDNSNGYWAFFIQSGASYNNAVLKIQFEKGSTATDFAPYFTPIELCKIGDYRDYIYKSGEKWYVHKEVDSKELNGSEEWNLAERSGSSNGVFYIDYNKIGTVDAKNNGAFSNYARFISGFVSQVGQFDTHYAQWRFYAPNNTITINEWKTNLASAPLVLYYLPATATEEEITNQALVAQLEALLTTARTFAGTNNIFTITPNEQGTLEICIKGGLASPTLMTGATSSTAGAGGLVPAPAAGDQEKFLKGDGTWTAVSGGGGTINDGRLTIQHNGTNVQTFTANQSSNATANIQTIYASTVSPASQVAQISTSSIQDEAITTAKIDDEAVTAAKIAWSSIFERIQVTVNLDAAGNATIGVGPADYWVVSVCELTTGGRNGNIVPYVWTDGKYWIHVDQNFNHAYITGNITVEVLLIKRSAIGM